MWQWLSDNREQVDRYVAKWCVFQAQVTVLAPTILVKSVGKLSFRLKWMNSEWLLTLIVSKRLSEYQLIIIVIIVHILVLRSESHSVFVVYSCLRQLLISHITVAK